MNRGFLLEGARMIPAPTTSGAGHAIEYERTAALLRRRAIQPQRSEDERVELQRRADWYERRAAVKRGGGIMPPELRTPLESLELVDELRGQLASVTDLARQLSVGEVEAFSLALTNGTRNRCTERWGENREMEVEHCLDLAVELLRFLGVGQNPEIGEFVFSPFVIRTAVSP
jgi:hypothetical protein